VYKRIGSAAARLSPRRLGRRGLIVLAAAGLLAGGGGVAFATVAASSPVDGNNVIHGCYTNAAISGSHVFVLQNAGTSCPSGTTAVSWNEQGSPGTPGANGTDGTNGTNGVSPTVAAFTGSEGSCTNGGDAITDANGDVTYICDGTDGTNGKDGTDGANGANAAAEFTWTGSCNPGSIGECTVTSGTNIAAGTVITPVAISATGGCGSAPDAYGQSAGVVDDYGNGLADVGYWNTSEIYSQLGTPDTVPTGGTFLQMQVNSACAQAVTFTFTFDETQPFS
jgi:hypothetical protein